MVSCNRYRLVGGMLKPCELRSDEVIEFVLGFEPGTEKCCIAPSKRLMHLLPQSFVFQATRSSSQGRLTE